MESKELLIVRQTRPKKGSRKMTTVKILFVIGVLSGILITQSGCTQQELTDLGRMTQLMGGFTDVSSAATHFSNR